MVFVGKEKILTTEHEVLENLTVSPPEEPYYYIGFMNGVVEMVNRLLEWESETV